jgi:hypothetical protein
MPSIKRNSRASFSNSVIIQSVLLFVETSHRRSDDICCMPTDYAARSAGFSPVLVSHLKELFMLVCIQENALSHNCVIVELLVCAHA